MVIGGGQSGLAGAFAVRDAGMRPVLLEAGDRTVGSWPDYYDSLTPLLARPVQRLSGRAVPR
ncbi:NAD(P)-binding protein [Kribbella caucasensis]|uniref:NAD(P)-binding protein n=1 Tax=Kribbella caucasensis TaxID=2512215 RepID=UPI0021075976|nr:NAD(P)-binding protein [Kribbella sp. VKM Ac-2527]